MMTTRAANAVAIAICAETCAFKGEPACFLVRDDHNRPMPWPNEECNEPGCIVLAQVAVRAMEDFR